MLDPILKEEHPIRKRRQFHLRNIAGQPITSDQPARFSLGPLSKKCPYDQCKALPMLDEGNITLPPFQLYPWDMQDPFSVPTSMAKNFAKTFVFITHFVLWFLLMLILLLLALILRLSFLFLVRFTTVLDLFILLWATSWDMHILCIFIDLAEATQRPCGNDYVFNRRQLGPRTLPEKSALPKSVCGCVSSHGPSWTRTTSTGCCKGWWGTRGPSAAPLRHSWPKTLQSPSS